ERLCFAALRMTVRGDALARLIRVCLAVAARGAGGTAGDLVAAAGDAAGAAADPVSGATPAARPHATRGDAGPHAALADCAAHDPRGAGHHWIGASAAQSAGAARRQRAGHPGNR